MKHEIAFDLGQLMALSSIGAAPECIRRERLDLTLNWREWKVTDSEDLLRPECEWEGARLPVTVSKAGEVKGVENALRDPAIFVDTDGRRYLLYSVAGEGGIAVAELKSAQGERLKR